MAVTKIWDIKGRLDKPMDYVMNPEKTENPKFEESYLQVLSDVIAYTTNEDKTERHFFVSGINCNTTCARRQFINVKKHFDKEDGIIAFHAYQSFSPGETTPEEAHKIGLELAEELWGDRFQVIVSTHLNTNCLHNHFLLNSVSFKDGKKYHDCRDSYRTLRQTSDRICREHGLSVVEKPQKGREPIYVSKASQAGMPTRYNVAREAIDEAISKSRNMHEFEKLLKQMGFATQFNHRRKYWTVTPNGWQRPIRLARLGEDYTNQRINERLLENQQIVTGRPFQKKSNRQRQYLLITRKDKINKACGLKGLYLKYCYQLGYLPKYKQNPNRVHALLKDDLMKCEKFTKQIRLLGKYEIKNEEDLIFFISKKESEMESLAAKRDELRKISRRVMPQEEKVKIKRDISEITEELKKLREEVKLGKDIKVSSGDLQKNLEIAQEEEKRREVRRR